MTVRELFMSCDTDNPLIMIYDNSDDYNVLYQKLSCRPIGRLKYWDSDVLWIYRLDCDEISIRINIK